MTEIDEVIAEYTRYAKASSELLVAAMDRRMDTTSYKDARDKYLQIAAWLEELKKFKEGDIKKEPLKGYWSYAEKLVDYRGVESDVWKCSSCRKKFGSNEFNFCPNCGADMRNTSKGEISVDIV